MVSVIEWAEAQALAGGRVGGWGRFLTVAPATFDSLRDALGTEPYGGGCYLGWTNGEREMFEVGVSSDGAEWPGIALAGGAR